MLFEVRRERFAEDGLCGAARLHRAELAFGLAFELDLAQFDGNDGGQSFEHVIAVKLSPLLTVLSVRVSAVLNPVTCVPPSGL